MSQPFQDYGVTPAGYVVPTFGQVQRDVRILLGDKLGITVDDSTTLAGMLADVWAEALHRLWEVNYDVWLGGQLAAGGVDLAHILQQVGLYPRSNQRSVGTVTTTGIPGPLLPKGRRFADTVSGDIWETAADSFIGDVVSVQSVEYGPIAGGPSHTYEIVTASYGWTGVTWATAATPGYLTESDTEQRAQHASILTGAGKATAEGIPIRAAVLSVPGVTDCVVEINDTNTPASGVPAHGLRVTVRGGTDTDICREIWNSKRLGGATEGNETVAVVDDDGISHVVKFDWATEDPVFVRVTLDKNASYPVDGDALVSMIVTDYIDQGGLGATLKYMEIFTAIASQVTGLDALTVELGETFGGLAVQNLVINKQFYPSLPGANLTLVTV